MKKAIFYLLGSLLCCAVSIYLLYCGMWITHINRYDADMLLFYRALGQLLIALPFLLVPLAHMWMHRLIAGCRLHRHFLWFPSIVFLLCWLYSLLGWVIPGIATPFFNYFIESGQQLLLMSVVFAVLQMVLYRFMPKQHVDA